MNFRAVGLVGCAVAGLSCSAPAPPPVSAAAGYRAWVAGDLIARFPADPKDMGDTQVLGNAFGFAVAADGQAAYILDPVGRQVVQVDADARLVRTLGQTGGGPGEFLSVNAVQPDPGGGVWVADAQASRLSLFGDDGRLIEAFRTDHPTLNYAVPVAGEPLFATTSAHTLLARREGAATEALVVDGDVPSVISRGPLDRIGIMALMFAPLGPDTLVMVQNRDPRDLRAWRVALSHEPSRISAIDPLPLPSWLHTMSAKSVEEFGDEAGEYPPFKSLRTVDGQVWIAPAASGLLWGVGLPRTPADSADVVLPTGNPERDAIIDMAVVGDRVWALHSTEFRVYALERAPGERFRLAR